MEVEEMKRTDINGAPRSRFWRTVYKKKICVSQNTSVVPKKIPFAYRRQGWPNYKMADENKKNLKNGTVLGIHKISNCTLTLRIWNVY
jgi:hypothetical protein